MQIFLWITSALRNDFIEEFLKKTGSRHADVAHFSVEGPPAFTLSSKPTI